MRERRDALKFPLIVKEESEILTFTWCLLISMCRSYTRNHAMSNQGDATTSLLPIYILNTFHSLPRALIKQMACTNYAYCKSTKRKALQVKLAIKAACKAVQHHRGMKKPHCYCNGTVVLHKIHHYQKRIDLLIHPSTARNILVDSDCLDLYL